jgi:biotin-(acetyl-CoA carboxylase) ligase
VAGGGGLNVNTRLQEWGDGGQGTGDRGQGTGDIEGQRSAVSLVEHDGASRDLTGVLISILDQFELVWETLIGGGAAELLDEYRRRCFLTGRTVTIGDAGGTRTVGRCLGIDGVGRLRLQTESGLVAITSGTVLGWEG